MVPRLVKQHNTTLCQWPIHWGGSPHPTSRGFEVLFLALSKVKHGNELRWVKNGLLVLQAVYLKFIMIFMPTQKVIEICQINKDVSRFLNLIERQNFLQTTINSVMSLDL